MKWVNGSSALERADSQEFLIRTRRGGMGDVFVSRRYGDFKRLADEVRDCYLRG